MAMNGALLPSFGGEPQQARDERRDVLDFDRDVSTMTGAFVEERD
jgi:hypothetical protein